MRSVARDLAAGSSIVVAHASPLATSSFVGDHVRRRHQPNI